MDRLRIDKQVLLHATREQVWDAVSDPAKFGAWFGVAFEGPFVEGQETVGRIVPTEVDPGIAQLQEPHRGARFRMLVERVEPMRLFAFRWHPYAINPAQNYDAEPMTLVSFGLEDAEHGVLLTISETGFEQLPVGRRDEAWTANIGGWEHQARLVAKYLAMHKISPGL